MKEKYIITIYFIFYALAIIGEVKCIIRAINCNWDPVGKAEIVYTVAVCTGVGAIVGWINIEDK